MGFRCGCGYRQVCPTHVEGKSRARILRYSRGFCEEKTDRFCFLIRRASASQTSESWRQTTTQPSHVQMWAVIVQRRCASTTRGTKLRPSLSSFCRPQRKLIVLLVDAQQLSLMMVSSRTKSRRLPALAKPILKTSGDLRVEHLRKHVARRLQVDDPSIVRHVAACCGRDVL